MQLEYAKEEEPWYEAGGVGGAKNDQESRVMGFHDGALRLSSLIQHPEKKRRL